MENMPKKHHKHQLTSYVVQRTLEHSTDSYSSVVFVVIWQLSCIAASSSGSANDIEDSRCPGCHGFRACGAESGVSAWHQRYTPDRDAGSHVAGCSRCRCIGRRVSLLSTTDRLVVCWEAAGKKFHWLTVLWLKLETRELSSAVPLFVKPLR